ncbi:MAG: hypothetical protein ACO1SV_05245 [Fimbriimonas sp.]
MRRAFLATMAVLIVGGLIGCGEEGPPKDNSNIKEPPAPAPPASPTNSK